MQGALNRQAYLLAVQQAGGKPLYIDAKCWCDSNLVDEKQLDGILFSGGGDINPEVYGKESNPFILSVDDLRDSFEIDLLHLAIERQIPFLGICRGLQLVDVACGGSLYYDLSQEVPSACEHDWHPSRKYAAHKVILTAGSLLHQIGYPSEIEVNSLHHQGIRKIGAGLIPIACATDGLIEAVEVSGHRFGLAVQWHPEWLIEQSFPRSLFIAFIKACSY
jgi:putative glutamine amidotransferase